jgi:hypothetical protein
MGDVGVPARFERLGIAFYYPDNWTLEEDRLPAGRASVTVYSPGGAFWSVALHPNTVSPNRLADAALATMKAEYEELEAEQVGETIAGHEMTGYDLNFYCLDLTNTASVRTLRTGQGTWTVFCQAEDREFDQLQQVFRAMTVSLLDGIDRSRGPAT